jgi:hypothetical protein
MLLLRAAPVPGQEAASKASAPVAETLTAQGAVTGAMEAADSGATADGASAGLPRAVRIQGVLRDGVGEALRGVQGVTFGLYAEQAGGAPLWLESQTVEADAAGR